MVDKALGALCLSLLTLLLTLFGLLLDIEILVVGLILFVLLLVGCAEALILVDAHHLAVYASADVARTAC